jgi:hypothetical protein
MAFGGMGLGGTGEIKLCSNNKEREMYDNLAELYSIIKTTEHLERAYIRDSISAKESVYLPISPSYFFIVLTFFVFLFW